MFRSVSNLSAAQWNRARGRQRHDFIDDLESFFWVYSWMMTVHNGPGLKRLVPQAERSAEAGYCETNVDPGFNQIWKRLYLKDFDHDDYGIFTPYFSKSVYLTLLHDLRTLLYSYCAKKILGPKDASGKRPEVDFFDEMDDIYTKVLGSFDTATQTLSPPPKPLTRLQSDRQAKRPRDEDQIAPLPNKKRTRLSLPRAGLLKNAIRRRSPLLSPDVRRSERLKAGIFTPT